MKAMKKILFLALVLAMALTATAFAAGTDLPGTEWSQLNVKTIVDKLEMGHCPQCNAAVSGYGMEIKWDCTEKFTATVNCGTCGTYTITKEALKAHEGTATRVLKEQGSTASCVQDGVVKTEEYCTVCGKTVQVYTANSGKLSHNAIANAWTTLLTAYGNTDGKLQQAEVADFMASVKAHHMAEYDVENIEITKVDATCTTKGSVTYDCKVCDFVKTVAIEALGHAYETKINLGGVKVVCEKEEHSHTANCYGITAGLQIGLICEKAEHTHTAECVVADSPACEKDAVLVQICATCGDRLTTVIEAAPGHQYTEGNKMALQGGKVMKIGTQKECEPWTEIEYCDCYGYKWVELEYTCENYRVIAEHKAEWTHDDADKFENDKHFERFIDNKATCTEAGKIAVMCNARGCNHVDYKDIPATNHKWDDDGVVKTAPTCTEDGVMVVKCLNVNGNNGVACKETTEITIKAVGHKEKETINPAGCNQTGLKVVNCTVCKAEISREPIPASHTWNVDAEGKPLGIASANIIWTGKEWKTITCEENGSFTFRCKLCPATQTITVEAPKHDWNEENVVWNEETHTYVFTNKVAGWNNIVNTVAPTCTEDGEFTLWCQNDCGTKKTFEGPKACGHYTHSKIVATIIEPTCYDAGLVVKQCQCGIKDSMPGELKKHDLRMQGGKLFCAAEGCTYTEEIKMDAQYGVSLLNVTVTETSTSGKGKIELIDGMGIKDAPLYARINFNFTLDNGENVAYVACVEVDNEGYFRMASPACPYGASLTNIAVMITTNSNAQDMQISDVPNLGITTIR